MQRQGHGGAEEAGQDHRHRTVEEQPDDQGALAEREGLGLAPKLDVAIAKAYANIHKIRVVGSYFRTDVGQSLWPPGTV